MPTMSLTLSSKLTSKKLGSGGSQVINASEKGGGKEEPHVLQAIGDDVMS